MGSKGGPSGRGFVWLVRAFVLLSGAVGVSACGTASSGHSDTSGGAAVGGNQGVAGTAGSPQGGSSTSGGTGSGGAASVAGAAGLTAAGGGPVLGDSKTEACISYAVAACERQEECSNRVPDCASLGFTCPDSLFSDGTTRTPALLKQCAEAYKTFPCDQLLAGYLPACVTPGTRTAGQPCAFGSQCTSLFCTKSMPNGTCGTCATPGLLGDDCTSASVSCMPGLRCGDAKKCETAPLSQAAPVQAGGPCPTGVECNSITTYCALAMHVCAPLPKLGSSCQESESCGDDSYCDKATGLCTARPANGSKCAVQIGNALVCKSDAECIDGTCVSYPAPGATCQFESPGMPLEFNCANGGHCDATSLACVAPSPPGASCFSTLECQAGLWCGCTDYLAPCTQRICNELRYKGESCDTAPGVVCYPGFACTNGVCQPLDSRGIFATCPTK